MADQKSKYGFCLDENFWTTYYRENEDSIIILLARLGAHYFNIPLNFMKKLALVCKSTFEVVQWRIVKCKELHQKYLPKFREALHAKLIRHPFKYTGRTVKVMPILEMGYSPFGIRIMDGLELFDSNYLEKNYIALTHVSFILKNKISFVGVCFLGQNAVMSFNISGDELIDLNEINPKRSAKLNEKYTGIFKQLQPGQYLAHLQLPIKINPITLGFPFIDMRRVHFCVAPKWYYNDERTVDIIFSERFVADNFTHAIMKFKTVSSGAYNWDKYCLAFNGQINESIVKTSLVQLRSEMQNKSQSNNAEILGVGYIYPEPDVFPEND